MKTIFNHNYFMLTAVVILIFGILCWGGMHFVRANEQPSYHKTFQTIEIHDGDTLSSIASEYAISEAYYPAYIAEVKEMNQLCDDTIHAGCYLIIPIYQ